MKKKPRRLRANKAQRAAFIRAAEAADESRRGVTKPAFGTNDMTGRMSSETTARLAKSRENLRRTGKAANKEK